MALTSAAFFLARPLALRFMSNADFQWRRGAWMWLTAVAFLSPNFYVFSLIAAPTLLYVGHKDSNPAALYVFLLTVVPPYAQAVPMIGMSYLMSADIFMLLALFLVLPAVFRLRHDAVRGPLRRLDVVDYLLIAYGLLSSFLYINAESAPGSVFAATATDDIRKLFVYFITVYFPFYFLSRFCTTYKSIVEVMAAFTLSCAVLCVIGVFEAERSWLLYADIGRNWGLAEKFTSYLMRGSSLRAMASTGHSLALGELLVVALGFWLYLQHKVEGTIRRLLGFGLFVVGLLAAYSRGPWYGAVCVYFAFAALSPRAFSQLFKAGFVAAFIAFGVYLSPLGTRILGVLPAFGGHVDNGDVEYRQRLLTRTWEIVSDHPLLGDQQALLRMQDLRQGQGIIDLINTYAGVLLGSGFVGLFLFLGFFLMALRKAIVSGRAIRRADPQHAGLGPSLAACIVGMLILFENGSFGGAPKFLFYALAALAVAYSTISTRELSAAGSDTGASSKLQRRQPI